MVVKVLILLAAFLTISSGLPSAYNTSEISGIGFPKIHKAVNLGSSPYLPLVKYKDITYYYGVILKGTAAQVELFCSYHNMKLVSIQTSEESENLISGLESFLQPTETAVFWTSGRKYGNDWRWDSTGRPAHYINWRNGEPNNNGGKENCIEVHFDGSKRTLEWNDIDCEATNFFICESRDQCCQSET